MRFSRQEILEQCKPAVEEAGEVVQREWSHSKNVGYKGRADLVTETDLAVEKELVSRLSSILPEAGLLAEETSGESHLQETTWIVDPLDGTTNFVQGLPLVAISVALWAEGNVQLGLVYIPRLGEMFTALRGKGAHLNGEEIHVSPVLSLRDSLIATGFPYDIEPRVEGELTRLKKVLLNCRGARRMGSAAIDLAYTACGRFEAYYEVGLKPWDTAAGWLLVEEAGGMVTTFDPQGPFYPQAPSILASNGGVHDQISQLLLI